MHCPPGPEKRFHLVKEIPLRLFEFLPPRLLLAISSTILTLLFLEGGFRIFDVEQERYGPKILKIGGRDFEWISGDIFREPKVVRLFWEFRPGIEYRVCFSSDERGYFDSNGCIEVKINREGLRDEEYPEKKWEGVFRIVCAGDSLTFGEGVREEDRFSEILETRLNEKGGGVTYEVMNCGIPGYDTAQKVTFLREKGFGYDPDLVILDISPNDIGKTPKENGAYLALYTERGGFRNLSRLYDYVLFKYRQYILWQRFIEDCRASIESSELRGNFEAGLADLAHLGRERGVEMIALIFPYLAGTDKRNYPFLKMHEYMRRELEKNAIPYIDLLDEIKGMKPESLWVHPTDHHPNERVHRIAADRLLEYLTESLSEKGPLEKIRER